MSVMTSLFQPGIEVQDLRSSITDQEYQLYVKLPWTYARSDKAYPALFSLDANRSFPLYSTMSLIYETPGTATNEIVIVGVGYKVDVDRIRGLAQWAAWRTRDLTPERSEQTEHAWQQRLSALLAGEVQPVMSGGASAFLKSLREEVIPYIEANYRVSSTDRGLAGFSYGGLFTLYALFHAPELFTRYFAGSPSMWKRLFDHEAQYAATHTDLKASVFISAGALESDLLGDMQRLVERLRSRAYPGLDLQTHVFDGEGHTSVYAAAISRALRMLYGEGGPTPQ